MSKRTLTRILVILTCALLLPVRALAQGPEKPFQAYLYNEEYQVYLQIDFYGHAVTVPGQEVFGSLPGYLGAVRDTRKWLITDATVKDARTATLSITNDYGSEDLTATLRAHADGTYILRQEHGSRIKIVVNRKWVKLPTELTFTRRPAAPAGQ